MIRTVVVRASVALATALATGLLTASTAVAAAPSGTDPAPGVDVSWPQCDTTLPTTVPFAVVGVNGGTAGTTNRCLAEQLAWAAGATIGSASAQPPVQLYVNTANPGEVLEEYEVTTWPTANVDARGFDTFATSDEARRNPYGRCTTTAGGYRGFTNDLACSWQYGWNRAVEAVDDRFAPAARVAGISDDAADYTWWLDVETMNSWQEEGPDAYARNTATLEGMTQLYDSEGVEHLGLYSTGYQWGQIVGSTLGSAEVGATLTGRSSWLAGAEDGPDAEASCVTAAGLTGGPVTLYQYIDGDGAAALDRDVVC